MKLLDTFHLIGIKVRTINKDKRAGKDIKSLWERFFDQQLLQLIPNKVNDDLYNVYTNYASDHLDWYDCFLGCKVHNIDTIPEGLESITVPAANYKIFTSEGPLPKVVLDTWEHIWASTIKRAYRADFDLYDEKAKNIENAIVKTYVSLL